MDKRLSTVSGNFLIRPFQSGDEQGVLDLWRIAFGRDMPWELWQWKFAANPFGRQIMLCLHEDKQLVVMFAGLPYKARYMDQECTVTHAVDNMSHPAYRGSISGRKGLFVQTAEAFFKTFAGPEGSAFVYGLPGARHFRLGSLLLGYRQLPGGTAYLEGETERLFGKPKLFSGRIKTVPADHAALDRLAWELRGQYPFTVLRDGVFRHWRFARHPFYEYETWLYSSFWNKTPKGYAVLKFMEDQAVIVDMMLPGKDNTALDFWARMARQLKGRGIKKLKTWLPGNHFQTGLLKASGFEEKQEPLGIVPAAVAEDFQPGLHFSWAAQNFYYTMADGDLY